MQDTLTHLLYKHFAFYKVNSMTGTLKYISKKYENDWVTEWVKDKHVYRGALLLNPSLN